MKAAWTISSSRGSLSSQLHLNLQTWRMKTTSLVFVSCETVLKMGIDWLSSQSATLIKRNYMSHYKILLFTFQDSDWGPLYNTQNSSSLHLIRLHHLTKYWQLETTVSITTFKTPGGPRLSFSSDFLHIQPIKRLKGHTSHKISCLLTLPVCWQCVLTALTGTYL